MLDNEWLHKRIRFRRPRFVFFVPVWIILGLGLNGRCFTEKLKRIQLLIIHEIYLLGDCAFLWIELVHVPKYSKVSRTINIYIDLKNQLYNYLIKDRNSVEVIFVYVIVWFIGWQDIFFKSVDLTISLLFFKLQVTELIILSKCQ